MKHRLSDGSGFLEIDHTNSPGLRPEDVAHVPGVQAVAGGTKYEADVQQCSHCQRAVVLNPGRVRARAVCPKCFHYICDGCEAARVASGGSCVPFKQVLDRAAEIAEKYVGQPDHPEAATAGDIHALSAPSAPRIVLTDVP